MQTWTRSTLLGLVLLASCSAKKTLVPFVFPQTPTDVVTGKTVIFYSTADVAGQAVRVAFEVSKDGGKTYALMTPVGTNPQVPVVVADPFGAPNSFYWDSFADLGPGVFPKCFIRATGYASSATGRSGQTLAFLANESGSFTPTQPPAGAARSNVLAVPLPDGSVLLAGGLLNGAPTSVLEVYDPSTELVIATSSLPVARTNVAGALLPSGRVLTVGGADVTSAALASAEVFSRATNTATAVPSGLVVARFDAAAAGLPGGFGVVAGGIGPGGALTPVVELYDPTAGPQGAFAAVASSTLAQVRLPTATALPDGRVLFAGGADANGNAVQRTFIFDPQSRTVSAGPAMTMPRFGHRACRLSTGKVLFAGGLGQVGNAATATASVEIFDPQSNAFAPAAQMARARAFEGLDLAGGRAVAAGGTGPAGDTASTAEVYDQDTNSWSFLPFQPLSARAEAVLVTSGPGRALLAGGGAVPEIYHPLDAPRAFVQPNPFAPPVPVPPPPPGVNPTTLPPPLVPVPFPFVSEAWIALRAPARARAFHTATRLTTGDVLLVGGTSGVASATNSVELFQTSGFFAVGFVASATDTVSTRASLLAARAHHAATFLPSGLILVSGGVDQAGNALGSLESYSLVSDTWIASAARLARPRFDHHAVALGTGDVLIVGGRDATGAPVGQAELYHPLTDTIENVGVENVPRADDDAIVTPTGSVLIAGGRDASGNAVLPLELYQPFTRAFLQSGALLGGRTGVVLAPSAALNELVATGGENRGVPRKDFEGIVVFIDAPASDPGGLGALDVPRAFHKVAGFPDLALLLMGGESSGLALDSSSLYVPLTDPFFFVNPTALQATVRAPISPRMNISRLGFTATPLSDGRILVAGGVDQRGTVVPGLETFVR